jgi:succinoglycan biosynthesis transport protein ExoP
MSENMMLREKEIHLQDYFNILRKRKMIVFSIFIITFTIVLISTLTATPIYEASTRLLIEKTNSATLMSNYNYVQFDPEFLQTQVQIITSYPVAKKVVKQLNLEETYDRYVAGMDESGFSLSAVVAWMKGLYTAIGKFTNTVLAKPVKTMGEAEEVSKADTIAEMVRSGITVEPVEETKIVELKYMSANPELATMIVNAAAQAYKDQLLDMKMQASEYDMKWMSMKGEDESKKLKTAKKALNEYIKANDIVTIEDRVTVIPQKLAELGNELAQAETRQNELASIYKKIQTSHNDFEALETMPVIADDPNVKAIRDQILKAEQNSMDQSKKYGPKHPLMIRVKSELNVLQAKRNQEIRRIIKTVENR